MFFNLSTTKEKNFPNNFSLGKYFFNCDSGWKEYLNGSKNIIYKGYTLEKQDSIQTIKELTEDPTPRHSGNFCAVIYDSKTKQIVLTHNQDRTFPLAIEGDSISNLYSTRTEIIPANSFLILDTETSNIEKKYFFSHNHDFTEQLEYNQALQKVDDILSNSFENFLVNNKKPIKIFLSGGIDTLLCYSYLKRFTKKFEILDYEYKKFTHFYQHNYEPFVRNYWAYNQFHTWGENPTVLISGASGDECFMRGPHTVSIWMKYLEIDMIKLLQENQNVYHYHYFMKNENLNYFKKTYAHDDDLQNNFKNKAWVFNYILNILRNDHQHWHFDDTIFFTPLCNLHITKIILNLSKSDAINQALDAQFTKDLIASNDPKDLDLLTAQKNKNSIQVLKVGK